MLLPLHDDRRAHDQLLQVLAGDLDVDAPPDALVLKLQPCLYPRTVEIAVVGIVAEPQQATRYGMVDLVGGSFARRSGRRREDRKEAAPEEVGQPGSGGVKANVRDEWAEAQEERR